LERLSLTCALEITQGRVLTPDKGTLPEFHRVSLAVDVSTRPLLL